MVGGEYATYIGDAYPRAIAAIATDASGNTYVAGNRGFGGLPTAVILDPYASLSSILLANASTAPNDVFVSKIDPSGKVLFTDSFAGKGFDQGWAKPSIQAAISMSAGPPLRPIFRSATRCNRSPALTAPASS